MTTKPKFEIDGDRCLVIAEIAQAHDGSLGFAHAYIDAVADAGADAIKFQTHIAAAESTPGEPWRVRFSKQDESRFEYWQRMEFTEAQWHGLKAHADERGIAFISSPFSLEAIDLLKRVGVAAWKIASGEVTNPDLLSAVSGQGQPVLISSGMSPLADLDGAVEAIRNAGSEPVVMQCTSAYPTPPEKIGLNVLDQYRQRYECAVGLSDHSGTIFPGLAAATLGAEVLEIHVTMSREMFGPDVVASITTAELRQLMQGVRFNADMRRNPVDKDAAAVEMEQMRSLFGRSLVAAEDLQAGHVLRKQDLVLRKPGSGLPASARAGLIGRCLKHPLSTNQMIGENDVE